MKLVAVTFERNNHPYQYLCREDHIQVGDQAIVDSPISGLTKVDVVGVAPTAGFQSGLKYIVSVISENRVQNDRQEYSARDLAKQRRFQIVRRLNELQVEADQLKQFAALAKTNKEAAALLKELRSIK